MTINIGNYNFESPTTSTDNVRNASGIYVILGNNAPEDRWTVVDIGESATLKTRLDNHDRKTCWSGRGFNTLAVAILYCNENQRMAIEGALREQYNPPCGKR